MVRLESNRSPRPCWHSKVWRGAAKQRFLGKDRVNEWLNLNAKHTLKRLILKRDNAKRSKFVLSVSEGYSCRSPYSDDTVGASLDEPWSPYKSKNTHRPVSGGSSPKRLWASWSSDKGTLHKVLTEGYFSFNTNKVSSRLQIQSKKKWVGVWVRRLGVRVSGDEGDGCWTPWFSSREAENWGEGILTWENP